MKILYVTTVGITMIFFKALIKKLIDEGNTVDIACNENESSVDSFYHELNCRIIHLDCSRSSFDIGNLKAVKEIKKIICENNYDIVHCHTAVASACTRIACKGLRKNGLKVFYTCHGFHFFKGSPLRNWMIYYPIEWICSFWTDMLITINKEDFELARRHFHAKRTVNISGVGIDVNKFENAYVDKTKKRHEIGVPQDAFLLISVGELSKRKNHEIIIRALARINQPDIHYIIAGTGSLKEYLSNLSKEIGVEDRVHLLGYRIDIPELYKASDAVVFPSITEGLGLAGLEGMAAGIPLVCSDNRGTREYAINGVNAIICNNVMEYADAFCRLKNSSVISDLATNAINTARRFDKSIAVEEMYSLYNL